MELDAFRFVVEGAEPQSDTGRVRSRRIIPHGKRGVKKLYSSSRWVTHFIPFVEMSAGGGTGVGLSSRGPDEGGRCCRCFPSGGVRD